MRVPERKAAGKKPLCVAVSRFGGNELVMAASPLAFRKHWAYCSGKGTEDTPKYEIESNYPCLTTNHSISGNKCEGFVVPWLGIFVGIVS